MARVIVRMTALLVALVIVPATVAAAATLTAKPDYRAGTVRIEATYSEGTAEVRFLAQGSPFSTAAVEPTSTISTSSQYRLREKTVFSVQGLDANGDVAWQATSTVDPATFRPTSPSIAIPSRKVVGRSVNVRANSTRAVTRVKARGDASRPWVTIALEAPSTRFTVPALVVVRGPSVIEMVAYNGFGASPRAKRLVFWIGSVPPTTRSCVADKSYMALFHVYRGRVVKWWPVAFGKSGTPTPNGEFKIGRPQPASGAWGVLRRRLYNAYSGRATSYYIHGTNAPWSIGTFASHGCIRMYNSHVREFARTVPDGTRVRIH